MFGNIVQSGSQRVVLLAQDTPSGGLLKSLADWYGHNADVIAQWAGRIGWALLILVIAWWSSGNARRAVRRCPERHR